MNKGATAVLYPVSDLASGSSRTARPMTGATPFWEVDDIKDAVAALTEAGATIVEDAHEAGGVLLPSGNLARERDSCAVRSALDRDSQPMFGSRDTLVVRTACIRCPPR